MDQHIERGYIKGVEPSLKGVKTLVARGLELGKSTELGLREVLAVEQSFGGRCRPDLVGRYYDGSLVVIDHKVKVKLDDRYLENEFLGYDTSNQFFHYAHFVGQELGEPVSTVFAHIIVLSPTPKTYLHPVKMAEDHVNMWLEGVQQTWRMMNKVVAGGSPVEARFSSCINKFGKCDMYELCHTYHGDESVAEGAYTRV